MTEFIQKLFFKFRQFITFGLVGCVNTLVDFLVFTLCYSLFALAPEYSQAAGYAAGIVSSFILNRRFTFRDMSSELIRQIVAFLGVNAVSLFISTSLMSYITDLGINAYLAKIMVTGFIMLVNYFAYKAIVFRDPGTNAQPKQHGLDGDPDPNPQPKHREEGDETS